MARAEAERLKHILEKASAWPIWNPSGVGGQSSPLATQVGSFGRTMRDIELWVALRESDRDKIKSLIGWPSDRDYRVDPLADRIANAYADLLFGEDPEITPGSDDDDDNMTELIEANALPSELRRAAADSSSEGEIWWRIYTDPMQAERPLVEFVSRLDVVPLFRGRKIVACAFVSTLTPEELQREKGVTEIVQYRHIEIQTDTLTWNLLYKGSMHTLGVQMKLKDHPETADFPDEWKHGIPEMLAGRVPNKLGRDWRLGVSDFAGVKDQLLDLNEARSIMAENARLTAKARMVVPMEAVKNGEFDAGSDVIVHEGLDLDLSGRAPGPYAVLEFNFQAGALLEHINSLTSTALTRVGLAEQFVGSANGAFEGNAGATGTALRTRLIPTTLAAQGKGRFWDDALPKILHLLARVDALPTRLGGFDHQWSSEEPPAIERGSVLPEDLVEETNRHVAAVGGEVESIETAVRQLHPDWSEEEITNEIDRIKEDRAAGLTEPAPPGFTPRGNPAAPGGQPTAEENPEEGGTTPPRPEATGPESQ